MRHRRPLRPGQQGVHAGHGEGGVRCATGLASPSQPPPRRGRSGSLPAGGATGWGADPPPRRRQFTIGIHDDLTHLSLDWDEDFRTDAARQTAARGVLGPGRRRHRVGQQELHQDRRRGHRPPGPGLFRLRLEEIRRGHRVPPALRPGAHPLRLPGGGGHGQLRRLPPDRVHRALRPAGPRRAGRRVPAQYAGTAGCGLGQPARGHARRMPKSA
jgi:hypothetical protein